MCSLGKRVCDEHRRFKSCLFRQQKTLHKQCFFNVIYSLLISKVLNLFETFYFAKNNFSSCYLKARLKIDVFFAFVFDNSVVNSLLTLTTIFCVLANKVVNCVLYFFVRNYIISLIFWQNWFQIIVTLFVFLSLFSFGSYGTSRNLAVNIFIIIVVSISSG